MKNLFYAFMFSGLLAFSCSDDPDPIRACNVDNVLDLPWLQERAAEIESSGFGREFSYISMGTYDSQTVFVLGNCCAFCLSIFPVYDCSGNPLGPIGPEGIAWDEITDRKVIWKSSMNSCTI